MDMNPQTPENIAEQNEAPIRIEKNLVQKSTAKDKTESYTVQLGSTYLTLQRPKNFQWSEAYQQKVFDQLYQMKEDKKLFHQICEMEEPLVDSKSGISKDALNRIRGGQNDLGKGSSPGARARSDARNAMNNRLKTKAKTKIKTQSGTDSIFVEGWSQIRRFPTRPRLNYYDPIEQRIVRPKLMFKAHLTCNKEEDKLPREITRQDKTIKFNKKFRDLFKKNYEVFGYNLYLEENLSKTVSNKEIRKAKDNFYNLSR